MPRRHDDDDEGRKRPRRKGRDAVVSIANRITPFRYQLKSPAIYDFYEGEYPLDWEKITATNPLRVVFQATYGRRGRHGDNKPDRKVQEYVNEAQANGVKYGLYHFLWPHSIAEQAAFYLDTVRSLGGFGNMEPIVDIEYEPPRRDRDALRGSGWANQIKAWLDIVENAAGMKPMIYTSAKFWAFTLDREGNPPAWTSNYRLWAAGYPYALYVDGNTTCPNAYIPKGWTEWAIWQYAEDGRYRQYPANDLNLVAASYAAALNLA